MGSSQGKVQLPPPEPFVFWRDAFALGELTWGKELWRMAAKVDKERHLRHKKKVTSLTQLLLSSLP